MSLHKLSAGHGYDYLIRQVAALDATHRGRTDLASYYAERGEAPGRWVGRGLAGVDGLDVGDVVTGEQMRLLFAEGRHPLADTSPGGGRVLALGVPYRPSTTEQPFQAALRARFADHNTALGLPRRAALPAEVRARLRGELAAEWFRLQEGRDPKGDLELASALARWSRPARAAVGGYDLTFSPVKSVSTLWAIADLPVAAQIEHAHHAAVAAALRFLEDHALYAREGAGGVRQVDVTGLVACSFTHRDSRAGDPDLHTHVAVANKVQTLGGRWLSIDGRILHAAKVAASETYNTALEHHLTTVLGVRFADRPGGDRSKRPVREIVGVDPRLSQRWSARRQVIDLRRPSSLRRSPTIMAGHRAGRRCCSWLSRPPWRPETASTNRGHRRNSAASGVPRLSIPSAATTRSR
jgi:conjugative relaxase-like TrwC/TraI family protein